MGPRPGAPCLCWASWLLGAIAFLSVWSCSAQGSGGHRAGNEDSAVPVLVKGIRGGSVCFHVSQWPGQDLAATVEEIIWSFSSESEQKMMLRVHSGTDAPLWFSVQDKYKGRVQMPNVTSLEIRNLTPQDSGRYMAYVLSTSTDFVYQVFHLKVYEPVSPPQIVAEALSVTAGWCNVTLECRPTGPTEDLNVTWESKGLPRELEQTWTPGPAPNPWTQAVSLPLSQASGSLTCVVSNPVDQNRATSDLRDICPPGASGRSTAGLTGGLLGGFVAVLLLLGAGLCLWKIQEKRKKMVVGKGLPQDHGVCNDDVLYADIITQNPHEERIEVRPGSGGQPGYSQVTHCPALCFLNSDMGYFCPAPLYLFVITV
ncbi:SLAM family member 5 isoform X2 [Fukomys damarensis]|uniref:SLAM family member 5 isoform X2 n=1 Tax=Fukomys damarensis TaxID=885580 RepID=UPI0008FF1FCD|nr:SLAM family member 5 isoform X2 [Fukomys damarensis]